MSNKSKLSILHTESSCGWGGQEIRIITESEGMIKRGHRVHIVCCENSNIYNDALKRGIPVTALAIERKKIPAVFLLRNWLKQNPFDIINTHSSTDSWLVALATRFMKNAPKIVRTRHVSAPVPLNFATRWLYTSASDYIVTTGEKLKQTLINHNKYPENKITSVPTGIDDTRFIPAKNPQEIKATLKIPKDKFIIGILATIRSWKGHVYLIEALAKLNRPDIHLLIVGDGPSRFVIEDALQKYQLNEQTTLCGNQDNVVPWLQSMDLFVLPSYANEGVPQGILQAMFCQLPVISTTVGSITEAVIHEETGLIVQPKNIQQLSEAILLLYENDELRNRYASNARKHVQHVFTADKMIDKMEAIFIKL